ncbi:serine/threonine-protein kinase [Nocardia arizonensis]|uniref:serine/threonine-protein kinase n=1 Tax=Nocardia arizonensis TaxID=1141647 RepID=UPI000A4E3BB6
MDDADSRVGARFGPYELRSLLGRGGMGEVYEAFDTVKGRVVAVKLLPAELAKDPVFQQRFRRESQAAARLAEPHIIPIHDWGEIDGVLYIDMRLVRGDDLRSVLRGKGPLSPVRAVAVIEQIAAALDAAHAEGLVHRDVKPANILVTPSDFAYLADFGIARSVGDPSLTDTGAAVGSYSYIAPERLDSAPISGTADVYSLACVLYECLTGSQPFPASALSVLIRAHLTTPPPRPSIGRFGLPQALDGVIARGMAKDPADRYPTASALAAAARAALTAPPPDTANPPRSAPPTVVFPAVDPAADPPTGDDSTTRRIPASDPARRIPVARPSADPDPDARSAAPTLDLGTGSGGPPRGAVAESNPRPIAGAGGGGARSRPATSRAASPGGAGESNPRLVAGAPAVDPSALGSDAGRAASAPTVDLGAVGSDTGARSGPTPRTDPGAVGSDSGGRSASAPTAHFEASGTGTRGGTGIPRGTRPMVDPGQGGGRPDAVTVDLDAARTGPPVRPPDDRAAAARRPAPRKQAQARIARPGAGGQLGPRPNYRRVDETAVTLERSALMGPPPAPKSRRGLWVLAVLVVAASIAGGVGWAVRDARHTAPSTQPSVGFRLPDGARTCTTTQPAAGRFSVSAVGTAVTSCPFAEEVRTAYGATGDAEVGEQREVTATSPVNDREYTMRCTRGTDYVTCTGGENAVVYLY